MKVFFGMRKLQMARWLISCAVLAGLVMIPWLTSAKSVAQSSGPNADGVGRYAFADLAEKVIPSVVTVYVKRDMRSQLTPDQRRQLDLQKKFFQDPQFRQFFGGPNGPSPDQQQEEGEDGDAIIAKGSGSGVIISADGYILTNWHVVGDKKDKPEIRVVLSDNTELTGKDVQLIDSSQLIDLALLKVNRTGLKPLPWGDSDGLRIGERVAAIGSPLDLRMTITQGIICAKHREVGMGLGDMLQTDAVINPGSSGGALVNLDGQLIGINRMIATPAQSGRWEGYGFAIPSKDAQYFASEILKNGRVTYGYIGVSMGTSMIDTPKMRKALGLAKDQKGVVVMEVKPGTPAANAGVQEGDFIVSADGQKIEDSGDLLGYVARRGVGSTIRLTVLRSTGNGETPKEVDVKITVAPRPAESQLESGSMNPSEKEKPNKDEQGLGNDLGLSVELFNEKGQQGLRVTGVLPGSPAARAGLQPGDLLLKLNRVALHTPGDLKQAISRAAKGRPHLLQFQREGRTLLTTIDQGGKPLKGNPGDQNDEQ